MGANDVKNLILGGTAIARILRYQMEDAGLIVDGYCMSEEYQRKKQIESFDERQIFAFERLNEIFGKGCFRVFLAVGYSDMNDGREALFHECEKYEYEIGTFVYPSVTTDTVRIGIGNIILKGSFLGAFSTIGNGNIIWGASTAHDGSLGDFNYLTGCMIGGETCIGNHCFIGQQAVTREGIRIGSYCLIGQGAVLNKSIADNMVVMPPKQRIISASTENMNLLLNGN